MSKDEIKVGDIVKARWYDDPEWYVNKVKEDEQGRYIELEGDIIGYLEEADEFHKLTEEEIILKEINDHALYWKSDRCKRLTVEKHLTAKGITDVTAKIDALAKSGKLTVIPTHSGDYLKPNKP